MSAVSAHTRSVRTADTDTDRIKGQGIKTTCLALEIACRARSSAMLDCKRLMKTSRIGPALYARIAKAWPDLIAALAAGESIASLLEITGLKRDHIFVYMRETPGAREEWEDAREASADSLFDQAIDTASNKALDPAHARMRCDVLKWAARIRNPRLYGDRAQLDVNVRTVDLTRIISDANARLAQARVIEHVPSLTLPMPGRVGEPEREISGEGGIGGQGAESAREPGAGGGQD